MFPLSGKEAPKLVYHLVWAILNHCAPLEQ